MRIAMVTASYIDISVGGVETHVHEVARALRARGHHVAVFRTRRAADRLDIKPRVTVGDFTKNPSTRFASVLRHVPELVARPLSGLMARDLAPAIARFKPDLVHFHDLSESFFLARVLQRTTDVPLVWTNHLGEYLALSRYALGRRILRLLTKPYSLAMAPSRELAHAQGAGISQRFIPNGYDADCFRPPSVERKSRLREELGLAKTDRVVLVPRRWAPNKGIHVLADALSLWNDAPSDAVVVFVGGAADRYGDYQSRVARVLRSAVPRIRLVGDVSPAEMPDWYAVADVTVIPSLREATSLSALESLGTGVPVVATRVGGLVDIASSFPTSVMLCDPGDAASLLQSVRSALERGSRLTPMALALRAQEQYSWATVVASVESCYESAF